MTEMIGQHDCSLLFKKSLQLLSLLDDFIRSMGKIMKALFYCCKFSSLE